ncbi:MAG: DUF4886 domain-containing protein [Pseudomonadota bacterium]
MKRTAIGLVAGLAAATAAPALAERLLFVGNSYLQDGGGVHVHTVALAQSAAPERPVEARASTIRGSRLDEQDIDGLLTSDAYDRVILQGHSTAALTPETRERFRTAVRRAHEGVQAQSGQTVLYMTPAYSPAHRRYDPEMFSKIAAEYTTLGAEIGAPVIPVGLAFEMAYAREPGLALHVSDGSHPTAQGTYLAAATAASALFDIDPENAAYAMDGAIDAEMAAFLRRVAADAVALVQDPEANWVSGAGWAAASAQPISSVRATEEAEDVELSTP